MLNDILESGLKLRLVDDRLSVRGSRASVREFESQIKDWKLELIKVLAGEVADNVGSCNNCSNSLLGLQTFDGYINRVCPSCGTWFPCIAPKESQELTVCNEQQMSLFSSKLAADRCMIGDLVNH